MASYPPSHETHLEEGLLPVVADEKRTLLTDTSLPGPGYPHSKHQKPHRTSSTAMAMARRFLILAVCIFVSFSLASVISPHMRCTRHQHRGDNQAALPEAHADGAELSEPVKAPEPDMLHRLLHAYFPKAFQDGVYPSDQDALSALEAESAGLASGLAHLAKRQDGGNDTEPTPSPTPSERTTERTPESSPTEPSTTAPPPPPPTTTRPPPPPSSSNPPPPPPPPSTSRSPSSPPPPPPASSSRPPPPPPPPSSEPTRPPTSSAAEPSHSGPSTSSEEESTTTTTTSTSSSRRTTTSSETSFASSSEVVTTRTSTDADGDVTVVTETSFVGVDPTPQTTSGSGENPNLQNAGLRNGVEASVVLAAGLVAAGAVLLL